MIGSEVSFDRITLECVNIMWNRVRVRPKQEEQLRDHIISKRKMVVTGTNEGVMKEVKPFDSRQNLI